MPAAVSCPIDPVLGHLVDAIGEPEVVRPTLLKALRRLPDPRDRRGRRHSVGAIVAISVCAITAGAKSFVAIAEWAASAGSEQLRLLGCGKAAPCESTIRRTLQRLDGDVLDEVIGRWAATRTTPSDTRRFIAVDGKFVRGAIGPSGRCRHLLSAITHAEAVCLGQVDVDVKTNEIPMFAKLLDRTDIRGCVVTADALHVQTSHATYLCRREAHFVLTVKANQPKLLAELQSLPWANVPASRGTAERGHGRCEKRTIKICSVAHGIGFPHAAQAFQITRKTRPLSGGKWRTEIVHGITSIPAGHIRNEKIADAVRGHWAIENKLHWVRDVTFDEDRSQIRTANGPRIMTSLRNLALSMLRVAGYENIAAALRHHHARSNRPITLLLTS